jgi:acetyltransferase-like isoleucine patch superfamily enzyme
MSAEAQIEIGSGCFLNRGTMLAAQERIEIGDHVMFANGCFIGDADHRYDDPDKPVTWQGFEPKGPVRIGSNCWFGANCVVTGGVEIGDRCVIGANSVVTRSLPPKTIAAGAPAKPIREIEFGRPSG